MRSLSARVWRDVLTDVQVSSQGAAEFVCLKDIDNINHVGLAVRDLAATAMQYESFGFLLTPFSVHSGAWKPNEGVQSFASGNRCVMFAGNYLEILASENAAEPSPRIEAFLKRHQGAHIICFNSENLSAVDHRIAGAGIKTSGVIPLQRDIDTPGGMQTAKFERVQFAPDDSPEGYIQAARHLTPQHIHQPRYIAHPNGCDRLTDTIIVTDDLAHFAQKYSRYIDAAPEQDGESATFNLPLGTRLVLVSSKRAPELLPGTLFPPLPGIAAVAFNAPDLAAQRARLKRAGVVFAETAGRLIVPAENAGGIAVIFESKR
jgi:hypothetical protein